MSWSPTGTMRGSETPQLLGNWDFYAFYPFSVELRVEQGLGLQREERQFRRRWEGACVCKPMFARPCRDMGTEKTQHRGFMKLSRHITCPHALYIISGDGKFFQTVKRGGKSSLESFGPHCPRLNIIHMPKWNILGRLILNLFNPIQHPDGWQVWLFIGM